MQESNKASLALGLCVMGLSGWAVASTFGWPWKAALFPLVIAIPVFCLAASEVLWVIFGSTVRSDSPDFQLSAKSPSRVMLRRTLTGTAWIVGFFVAVVLLGFPVAVPFFVFLYAKVQGRESWAASLALALGVWGIFYGLLDRLLHLPFPEGWISAWIGIG
jgi:hypothetical protein